MSTPPLKRHGSWTFHVSNSRAAKLESKRCFITKLPSQTFQTKQTKNAEDKWDLKNKININIWNTMHKRVFPCCRWGPKHKHTTKTKARPSPSPWRLRTKSTHLNYDLAIVRFFFFLLYVAQLLWDQVNLCDICQGYHQKQETPQAIIASLFCTLN